MSQRFSLVQQPNGNYGIVDLGQGRDFVFRPKGDTVEFVGDFDGLYSAERDPWEQSGDSGKMAAYYRFSRRRLIDALRGQAIVGLGLEIGCGHGHLTALLRAGLGVPVVGIDVSAAAIAAARRLNPHCGFSVGDITAPDFAPGSTFGFIILAQCLWYVLHEIDRTVENVLSCLEPGGLFVVSQAFMKGEQLYAREIADGFHGTLAMFLDRFPGLRLIEARYDDSGDLCHNDGLLVFRRVAPDAQPGDRAESGQKSPLGGSCPAVRRDTSI